MAAADSDLRYKAILVGSSAVGKTSLVQRFVKGTYDERVASTVGSEHRCLAPAPRPEPS